MPSRLEPVTVVISRKVKPGKEPDYEAWIKEIAKVSTAYEGHLGMNVFRPQRPGEPYVLVYKFDSGEHLDVWLQSDVRTEFVKRAEAMVDESHVETTSGLESWFTLPGAVAVMPPPKWKMAVVTGASVWTIAQALRWPVQETMGALPAPVTGLVTTAIMVSLLTWVVMPRLTRLLAPWLFPRAVPRPGATV